MKDLIRWLIISFAVMALGPKLAAMTNSMALVFILWYALFPIYSALIGFKAGKDVRAMWLLPILSAAFFLLGPLMFFDIGDRFYWICAGVYLAIGILSMAVSNGISRNDRTGT